MGKARQRAPLLPAGIAAPAEGRTPGRRIPLDAFLSELLEAIPDMVLVLDAERQAIAANRQALTTLGKTEDLLVGLRDGRLDPHHHLAEGFTLPPSFQHATPRHADAV